MTNIIFCDLDGTLCDDRHRIEARDRGDRHLAEQGEAAYDDYHSQLESDDINEAVHGYLLERHDHGDRIVLFSSRPRKWRWMTRRWLSQFGWTLSDNLASIEMRPTGDLSPAPELKEEHINRYLDLNAPLNADITIIDDDEGVLRHLGEVFFNAALWCIDGGKMHKWAMPYPYNQEVQMTDENSNDGGDDRQFDSRDARQIDSHNLGKIMEVIESITPNGVIAVQSQEGYRRMGAVMQIVTDLARYCAAFNDGGDAASLENLIAEAQLLEKIDGE